MYCHHPQPLTCGVRNTPAVYILLCSSVSRFTLVSVGHLLFLSLPFFRSSTYILAPPLPASYIISTSNYSFYCIHYLIMVHHPFFFSCQTFSHFPTLLENLFAFFLILVFWLVVAVHFTTSLMRCVISNHGISRSRFSFVTSPLQMALLGTTHPQ